MRTCICLTLFAAITLCAQQKEIKQVALEPTSPTSGPVMFRAYCAACHGLDGKGDGPAASALKKRPANLTQLALKHGGKFPEGYVTMKLKTFDGPSHGSESMPIWGPLLSSVSHDTGEVQLRINNIVAYIASLQEK